jgi:hypothetical protein
MRRRTESSTVAYQAYQSIFVRRGSALAIVLKGGDKTGYGDRAAYELLGAGEALLRRDVAADRLAGPVLPTRAFACPPRVWRFAIVRPFRSQPPPSGTTRWRSRRANVLRMSAYAGDAPLTRKASA